MKAGATSQFGISTTGQANRREGKHKDTPSPEQVQKTTLGLFHLSVRISVMSEKVLGAKLLRFREKRKKKKLAFH